MLLITGISWIWSMNWSKRCQVTCHCTVLRGDFWKVKCFLTSLSFWMRWKCIWRRTKETLLNYQNPSGLWIWPFSSTYCHIWTNCTRSGSILNFPCKSRFKGCLRLPTTEAFQHASLNNRISTFSNTVQSKQSSHCPENDNSWICSAAWKTLGEF